jgi:hypothetical protein
VFNFKKNDKDNNERDFKEEKDLLNNIYKNYNSTNENTLADINFKEFEEIYKSHKKEYTEDGKQLRIELPKRKRRLFSPKYIYDYEANNYFQEKTCKSNPYIIDDIMYEAEKNGILQYMEKGKENKECGYIYIDGIKEFNKFSSFSRHTIFDDSYYVFREDMNNDFMQLRHLMKNILSRYILVQFTKEERKKNTITVTFSSFENTFSMLVSYMQTALENYNVVKKTSETLDVHKPIELEPLGILINDLENKEIYQIGNKLSLTNNAMTSMLHHENKLSLPSFNIDDMNIYAKEYPLKNTLYQPMVTLMINKDEDLKKKDFSIFLSTTLERTRNILLKDLHSAKELTNLSYKYVSSLLFRFGYIKPSTLRKNRKLSNYLMNHRLNYFNREDLEDEYNEEEEEEFLEKNGLNKHYILNLSLVSLETFNQKEEYKSVNEWKKILS